MKKNIDLKIKTLIENGIKTRHRTFFIIIGNKGHEQVILNYLKQLTILQKVFNFHSLLSKILTKEQPKVLWCHKNELAFSTNRLKHLKDVKKLMKNSLNDSNQEAFDQFINAANVRYCHYKETQNVLGNTFNMLVLQDFESLTPNILCRTMETVEGGLLFSLILNENQIIRWYYNNAI